MTSGAEKPCLKSIAQVLAWYKGGNAEAFLNGGATLSFSSNLPVGHGRLVARLEAIRREVEAARDELAGDAGCVDVCADLGEALEALGRAAERLRRPEVE